ncbi:MAG: hypothetical protein ACYCS7_07540 [Acidimicrobiales bacterium]
MANSRSAHSGATDLGAAQIGAIHLGGVAVSVVGDPGAVKAGLADLMERTQVSELMATVVVPGIRNVYALA